MLKNEKLNNLLHAQSIRRRLNSYNFAADCLMDDGQSFLMVPSEAIAMALTQGRLNKDFKIFIDGDKARRQEKLIREYEKKMDEESSSSTRCLAESCWSASAETKVNNAVSRTRKESRQGKS